VLFDHCAVCRGCCHVDTGYPALEVTLTAVEKKKHGSLCIETRCQNLGDSGCTLGDDKPFSCQLYPLSFNPKTSSFMFDVACPLMPEYQRQLQDGASEAAAHFGLMAAELKRLALADPSFLRKNFKVDEYYFDLQALKLTAGPEDKLP
jgi:Fe-S-cluster containining protein